MMTGMWWMTEWLPETNCSDMEQDSHTGSAGWTPGSGFNQGGLVPSVII